MLTLLHSPTKIHCLLLSPVFFLFFICINYPHLALLFFSFFHFSRVCFVISVHVVNYEYRRLCDMVPSSTLLYVVIYVSHGKLLGEYHALVAVAFKHCSDFISCRLISRIISLYSQPSFLSDNKFAACVDILVMNL